MPIVMAATEPQSFCLPAVRERKTEILQVSGRLLQRTGHTVALAAPDGSGRAADGHGRRDARRGPSTGCSILRASPAAVPASAAIEQNQIEADILIIDEMSMVDIMLMRSLLAAVAPATSAHNGWRQQPALLGGARQCPRRPHRAQAGSRMSSCTKIFRQAAQSRIVTAAHEIMNGDSSPLFKFASSTIAFSRRRTTPNRASTPSLTSSPTASRALRLRPRCRHPGALPDAPRPAGNHEPHRAAAARARHFARTGIARHRWILYLVTRSCSFATTTISAFSTATSASSPHVDKDEEVTVDFGGNSSTTAQGARRACSRPTA